MIRVAIVDDQNLMREGLKTILNTYPDLEVVATGKDGREAVDICIRYTIDVLLLDIRMPILNGVDAVKEIKKINQKVKIIILTTFDDEDYIVEAMGHGACGYLFKDIAYDELVRQIKLAHQNQMVMPTKVAQVIASKLMNHDQKKDELKQFQLTARELEICEMLKDSFTNKQIASMLCISEGTVKNYISSLYAKTGYSDRKQLITFLNEVL